MLSRVLSVLVIGGFCLAPFGQDDDARLRLDSVRTWFYYLAVEPDPEVISRLIDSDYDMVVIDLVVTDRESQAYDIVGTVRALQDADKLVLAYVDIGQAESYRTYWEPDWSVGDPAWIAGEDPDGWAGNYPVAYWWDEWRALWFEPPHALLDAILAAGFDGIYMDWVEAYSDPAVIALAEQDDVDPRQEMIWFVQDISAYLKDVQEDFIVIAQNAAELVGFAEYVEAVDAIAQEQTWFDGRADGDDPEGDCPLPATDADIETGDYINSLSAGCQALFYEFPDSTLHVSTEGYLHYLVMARDAGLAVFTVDYALEPENIAYVYETARELGFIPFASNRMLDRYISEQE